MSWLPGTVALLSMGLLQLASRPPELDPEERYSALLKQYGSASRALRLAETDPQRQAAVETIAGFPAEFLQIARDHPAAPIAVQCLRQATQASASADSAAVTAWENRDGDLPLPETANPAGEIVDAILRDHLHSDQLAPVCDRMRYGYRLEFAKGLEAILRDSPHREVRAMACLALAQFLNDRLHMLQLAVDRPELGERYERMFGKAYLGRLREMERDGACDRVVALFERAAEEFGDVPFRDGTIGGKAKAELYEIRNLGIGMAAPEIEGIDQFGRSLKLSDYRGQVVLLYFWMEF